MSKLVANNHSRDIAGLTYIYPVLSRRAGGLSIGVNFNTNNACNWRCIYCQVPNLTRGSAPVLDFQLLEAELRFFLNTVLNGDFYQRFQVPLAQQVIKDIAISGNGEPTSLKNFAQAVALVGQIATELGIFPASNYVLISNGSLIQQAKVQAGLQMLKKYGGELWFKLDSATPQGRRQINNSRQNNATQLKNLLLATQYCPTKLQICLLDDNHQGLVATERDAFLNLFHTLKQQSVDVQKIMLYSIARESQQPEAAQLAPLSNTVLNGFAEEIRQLGFDVSVNL